MVVRGKRAVAALTRPALHCQEEEGVQATPRRPDPRVLFCFVDWAADRIIKMGDCAGARSHIDHTTEVPARQGWETTSNLLVLPFI